MKNFKLSLVFMVLISISVSAQTAQQWMDNVSETYKKAPSYYLKFELKLTKDSKPETGELFAVKEKYSVQVMDVYQMYDGKKLFTVSKEDQEVTISRPAPDSDDFLTPTKVLAMYKTNFKPTLDKSGTLYGNNVQYVKLSPTTKSEVSYVMIAINKKNNTLVEYKEYFADGDVRILSVKEYLENLIIPSALFKFDKSKYEKDGYIVTTI
ncbi:MAG: LolA-like putative outer membrane lipoprotein chaperone [Weeksellaceae bacterium]